MDSLTKALIEYVDNTENPEKNYNLAIEYELLKQYAAAISFYTRCSERTNDKELVYTCLLKIANCFDIQKDRAATVRGFYKQAITLIPDRPEAYFLLSRHYEWVKEYSDSYFISSIALTNCDFNLSALKANVGYPGKYGLIFEKAVSSWWWGKSTESRKLFHLLADEYRDEMTEEYVTAVQNNLTNLGSGPESQAFRYFFQKDYSRLKHKFKGSENIERNFSQVFQDMFVLSMLNGKKNGTYLEIGSSNPYLGNNTYILEKMFDWSGVGIEYKEEHVQEYRKHRKNPVIHKDATKVNYDKVLKEIAINGVVDYLQLDCEPSKTTFEILLSIPFDKYKFAVITYEHDYYVDITRSYREKSRNYLSSLGYKLVVNDVSPDGVSTFEDWWVHPACLIDTTILQKMTKNDGKITKIEDYIFL